ncbi:MAG: hypothetical protein ACI92S_003966, partial [Planctomycetaceae bacterium]
DQYGQCWKGQKQSSQRNHGRLLKLTCELAEEAVDVSEKETATAPFSFGKSVEIRAANENFKRPECETVEPAL